MELKFKEHFDDNHFGDSYLSFRTIQMNKSITNITTENNIYDKSFAYLSNKYAYIKYTDKLEESDLNLINSYKFYRDNKKNNVLTITKLANLCIFFCNNDNINETVNLVNDQYKFTLIPELINIKDNKKIGYVYDYEREIINYIFKSLDIDIKSKNISLINIKFEDIINNLFDNKIIDIYFYFNTLDHSLLNEIISKNYTIINYDKININIMKQFIPFCRLNNVIIKNNFEDNIFNINNQINLNCLLIDNLIYEVNYSDYSKYIIKMYNNAVLNNYYSTFFNFIEFDYDKIDYTGIYDIEENFTDNSDLNISQNNKQLYLQISLIDNIRDIQITDIPNEDKDIIDTLFYKINTIFDDENVPFEQYDILNISSNNEKYNNKFYIHEIKHNEENSYAIISKYLIIYQINTNDKLELNNANSSILFITPSLEFNMVKNNDLIYVLAINKEAIYLDGKLKILNINDNLSSQFVCFDDPSITSKSICEGTKNIDGTVKKAYNWDRMCMNDNECDFYLSNKNYLNKRGGCKNGYCELPLGIKRLSFKKYELNENSYPICFGCKEGVDPKDCCDLQKNDSTYQSPNYAFENDIISKLDTIKK